MEIVPVLDLLGGVVVRGVAGDRARYRPIVSRWSETPDPLAMARGLHRAFGFRRFYVADLNAVMGGERSEAIYRALHDDGFFLILDAGVRTIADVAGLIALGVDTVVVGLETVESAAELQRIGRTFETERLLFSLDMKDGAPLMQAAGWPQVDPASILQTAVESGFRRILLLDLARVGAGVGVGTETLVQKVLNASTKETPLYPYVGGGVRGAEELQRLETLGVAAVLVASALHDGRLGRADLQCWLA